MRIYYSLLPFWNGRSICLMWYNRTYDMCAPWKIGNTFQPFLYKKVVCTLPMTNTFYYYFFFYSISWTFTLFFCIITYAFLWFIINLISHMSTRSIMCFNNYRTFC